MAPVWASFVKNKLGYFLFQRLVTLIATQLVRMSSVVT